MSIISIAGVLSLGAGGGVPGVLTSPATITVDHTKAGGTDTADFVMLFSETDGNFRSVANGGVLGNVNDFRFASDSGGSSLLTWEIIKWDDTTGQLVAVVNIGTLSHTVDPVRYLLFDGTSRGSFLGGSLGAIWDSNFKTVWTGGDGTSLDITDHTANADDGTNHLCIAGSGPNGLGAVDTLDAAARSIRGSNTLNIAHPTVEALVYVHPPLPGGRVHVIGFVIPGGAVDHNLSVNADGTVSWYIYDGAAKVATSAGVVTAGVWAHILGKADGSNAKVLVNGTGGGTLAAGDAFTAYGAPGLQLQGDAGGGNAGSAYGMKVSMVRVSDIARSDDYALATANSFIDPSTFHTVT